MAAKEYRIASDQPTAHWKESSGCSAFVVVDYGGDEYAIRYQFDDGTNTLSDRGVWIKGAWNSPQDATDAFFEGREVG